VMKSRRRIAAPKIACQVRASEQEMTIREIGGSEDQVAVRKSQTAHVGLGSMLLKKSLMISASPSI
jgi:hypothetical protein